MLNSEYSPDWYVDLHTVSFIVTNEVYKGGGGRGGGGHWHLRTSLVATPLMWKVEVGRKFLRDHIVDIV